MPHPSLAAKKVEAFPNKAILLHSEAGALGMQRSLNVRSERKPPLGRGGGGHVQLHVVQLMAVQNATRQPHGRLAVVVPRQPREALQSTALP